MYIRNRHSPGLGYFGTTPEEYDAQAAMAENNANAATDPAAKLRLQNEAIRLRGQASSERARLAEEARSRQATMDLASSLRTTGESIGSQLLAQRTAVQLAKLQSKAAIAQAAAGPGTTVINQGGLSSGAMIGIGVGVAALLVVVLVVATKK